MDLDTLDFNAYFEETADKVSERLQLMIPEGNLERDLLAWSILPHGETVTDDSARRGYVFTYDLGQYIDRGLYRLKLSAKDASGELWHVEIAAALISTGASANGERSTGFAPFWFLSKHLHFKPSEPHVADKYGAEAYGHLEFSREGALPHRRLFRAT